MRLGHDDPRITASRWTRRIAQHFECARAFVVGRGESKFDRRLARCPSASPNAWYCISFRRMFGCGCDLMIRKKMIELLGVRRGETETIARARDSRRETAFEMTLKIDDQVEMPSADSPQKRNERPRRVRAIVHDDFVEPAMMLEYRLRLGFHRPRDVRVGPRVANAPEQRQRANHVADRADQHDQHATRRRRDLRGDGFRRGHFRFWSGSASAPTLDDNDADRRRKERPRNCSRRRHPRISGAEMAKEILT